ncbi:MAG: hypothetical protein KF739_02425 [Cryobacterium sp.]|nr:hypothetical protein [Cryobacterium sp.]HNP14868.1 GH116 family glycosyl hydrolase [Terrimesophilobacter sp.]
MTFSVSTGRAERAAPSDFTTDVAAFPLGGIGTGNVSIGARGQWRDWELANRPGKGSNLPFSFFAIRTAQGGNAVARVLESSLAEPHAGDQGYDAGRVAGLPRLAGSHMVGEYPILRIDFTDDGLPVEVSLTSFTPFVPLDADASGIPGAVMRYSVTNPTATPIDVTIAGSLANPVGISGYNVFHLPHYDGQPANEWVDDGRVRGIRFSTDLAESNVAFGTAALMTTDTAVSAKPQWLSGYWQDGAQVFWDEFRDTGSLTPESKFSIDEPPYPEWFTKLRIGSLAIRHELAPGETRDFEFFLTWHFPNRPRAWQGNINLDNTHSDEIVRNHYATLYPEAVAVAQHLAASLPELESATRAFHRALFESSLPASVIDAASANLAALRSTTCFRVEGGVFAAWEGSFDHAGSCEGTCTHVWNYAQSAAWLFPELERSARRTEFLHEVRADGRMNFRANSVFGNEPWDFHAAVDGQLGAIIRLYREWRFSGDNEFLRECWPGAGRALEYAFTHWDSNGDGVLDSEQHNTYDIEFHGENSLANSMFFAALKAAAVMADHLGEPDTAARYRAVAGDGAETMDRLLFNGEYYEQKIDDVDEHRYQYGTGCLSDQVFGQLLAHLVGLGHILPAEHVKSAVGAIFRHNFRTDLTQQHSVQRTYALNGEQGLVLCSWPRGGRPRIPYVYSDEVWTGIEYQVAAHLIFEGLVDEGVTVVDAVRSRHDGRARNPWNEVECGNHYARSLASWAPLIALSGAQWDAQRRRLSFSPATSEPLACFFSTGTGWGRVTADESGLTLVVDGGTVTIDSLALRGRELQPEPGHVTSPSETGVAVSAGQSLRFTLRTTQEEPS